MNNYEINQILKSHSRTKSIFLESLPCDKGPNNEQHYPYALVMNTDFSGGRGIHWIAIFALSDRSVEYFDSYGMPPNKCIYSKFLQKFASIKRSEIRLQSYLSSVCGHYCVYFIVRRCYGETFENIIKGLRDMGEIRDSYVREYTNQLQKCLIPYY